MSIDSLVIVCARKDLNTLRFSQERLRAHLGFANARVIVPDSDVKLFRSSLNPEFDVMSEDSYADLSRDLSAKISRQHSRFGWYLQQLLKIAALVESDDSRNTLIWDADTIPLRDLKFESNGKVIFYSSADEYHAPYFRFIEGFLSLESIHRESFIAQCMFFRGKWIKHFVTEVEERYGIAWYKAIINTIDFNQTSGFSEFELLGNYVLNRFPSEIVISKEPWIRDAGSPGLDIHEFEAKLRKIPNKYLYASFEANINRYRGIFRSIKKKWNRKK